MGLSKIIEWRRIGMCSRRYLLRVKVLVGWKFVNENTEVFQHTLTDVGNRVNELHAKLQMVSPECRLLATQQFSTSNKDLAAWKTAGLLKGIPETWDALDDRLRTCEEETGEGKEIQAVTSDAAVRGSDALFPSIFSPGCNSTLCYWESIAFGVGAGLMTRVLIAVGM
jgi:hypothetical protein